MRFEPVKSCRKDNKVNEMIEQFLKSRYKKVEIFNENDFENTARFVAALRFSVKSYYADLLDVSRIKERVFLTKKEK